MDHEITTGALAKLFDTTRKTIADLGKREIIVKGQEARLAEFHALQKSAGGVKVAQWRVAMVKVIVKKDTPQRWFARLS